MLTDNIYEDDDQGGKENRMHRILDKIRLVCSRIHYINLDVYLKAITLLSGFMMSGRQSDDEWPGGR